MTIRLEKISEIPPRRAAALVVLVFLLLGYSYYFFLIGPLAEKNDRLETRLEDLTQWISKKELIAQEVEKNKRQLLVLKENLATALTKLPDQKEIPGLLTSLSEAGKSSGLDFVLFEPVQSISKEFYAEIPVKMIIHGRFHDTVVFFEKIARLPRIVSIADIAIGTAKEVKDGTVLTTSCRIKTYMFVEKSGKPGEAKDDKKK